MPNAITRKQFDDARQLVIRSMSMGRGERSRENLTNKAIAERISVSEETVRKIRTGKLKRPPADVAPAKPRLHDGVEFRKVDQHKCTGCGSLVTLEPCLICHERAKRERKA